MQYSLNGYIRGFILSSWTGQTGIITAGAYFLTSLEDFFWRANLNNLDEPGAEDPEQTTNYDEKGLHT